jgi:STE24 endopeptidase
LKKLNKGYLDFRQYLKYSDKNIPKLLLNVITQEEFDKSRNYGKEKTMFAIIKKFIEHSITLYILYYSFLPYLWNKSEDILIHFGFSSNYEVNSFLLK